MLYSYLIFTLDRHVLQRFEHVDEEADVVAATQIHTLGTDEDRGRTVTTLYGDGRVQAHLGDKNMIWYSVLKGYYSWDETTNIRQLRG